jgi:hypothetical protein
MITKEKQKEYNRRKCLKNKELIKEKSKLYYEKNKELIKEKSKLYYEKNKEKILDKVRGKRNDYHKEYRLKNYEKEVNRNKLYCDENRDWINEKDRQRYKENTEYYKDKSKKYQKENPQQRKITHKNRLKTDNLYRLSTSIRKSIWCSINKKGYTKKSRTNEILGCDFELFEFYIRLQLEPWMSWNNYGKYNGELNYGWDLDHIIPISSATTEEEVIKLNHYTNFQPLCSKVNRDIKRNFHHNYSLILKVKILNMLNIS